MMCKLAIALAVLTASLGLSAASASSTPAASLIKALAGDDRKAVLVAYNALKRTSVYTAEQMKLQNLDIEMARNASRYIVLFRPGIANTSHNGRDEFKGEVLYTIDRSTFVIEGIQILQPYQPPQPVYTPPKE